MSDSHRHPGAVKDFKGTLVNRKRQYTNDVSFEIPSTVQRIGLSKVPLTNVKNHNFLKH